MALFSIMITILSIVFWLFRFIVCIAETLEISFICTPLNTSMEIALLFATVPCMVFVLKRNIIGAACYLALHVSYFGTALYNTFIQTNVDQGLNVSGTIDEISAIFGIGIALLTFLDILFNKHRALNAKGHRKTDWYYNNDKYDREYDERADRNQYKIR